jgi:hypothetical protein
VLLLTMLARALQETGDRGAQITREVANCHRILIAIRLYAADEGGIYPDSRVPAAKDSNTVFRQLFIAGSVDDETIFGCGVSPFVPDGKIGAAPDYRRAVEPGENHWAMTKGLDDSSPGGIPLIYENPTEATWPPTWNADAAGKEVKGRAWKGGKILIGTNDTSVELWKLDSSKGAKVPLKPWGETGKNLFEQLDQDSKAPKYEVLDIAR